MSLSEVQKPKAPQTNWSEHVKVFDGSPSSVTKHLSSNFLYALESQKPGRCRDMVARYYVYMYFILSTTLISLCMPSLFRGCLLLWPDSFPPYCDISIFQHPIGIVVPMRVLFSYF